MILCVCVYVDLHVSMGQFVCMSVISMYIYIHIYTYNICLVHSCHVQVQIFWLIYTHQKQSIFLYTHKTQIDSHTCVMKSSYFWGIQWWKKITKNSRELAVWRVSTSQKKNLRLTPQNKSLRRPCGASRCARLRLGLRFGSVFVVRSGNRTELQPLSSVRLEYRGRTLHTRIDWFRINSMVKWWECAR